MNPKPSPQLTGVAGEYFVAAELSRRGYIASITMRNSPRHRHAGTLSAHNAHDSKVRYGKEPSIEKHYCFWLNQSYIRVNCAL
jgi:hypothetical protein